MQVETPKTVVDDTLEEMLAGNFSYQDFQSIIQHFNDLTFANLDNDNVFDKVCRVASSRKLIPLSNLSCFNDFVYKIEGGEHINKMICKKTFYGDNFHLFVAEKFESIRMLLYKLKISNCFYDENWLLFTILFSDTANGIRCGGCCNGNIGDNKYMLAACAFNPNNNIKVYKYCEVSLIELGDDDHEIQNHIVEYERVVFDLVTDLHSTIDNEPTQYDRIADMSGLARHPNPKVKKSELLFWLSVQHDRIMGAVNRSDKLFNRRLTSNCVPSESVPLITLFEYINMEHLDDLYEAYTDSQLDEEWIEELIDPEA